MSGGNQTKRESKDGTGEQGQGLQGLQGQGQQRQEDPFLQKF